MEIISVHHGISCMVDVDIGLSYFLAAETKPATTSSSHNIFTF